jgi:hypothetical protein
MQLLKKKKEQSLFKIFSFYNKEVHPDVPFYQKAVFRHFGLSINQVFNNKFSHGDFLNDICTKVSDTDYIIIFDIDCIPINRKWIGHLLEDLLEPHTLVGAAQTANHLRDGKNLYISPFFFAISTTFLKELNYPDMRMTEQIKKSNDFPDAVDAGQNLSEAVAQYGGKLKFWWPTHIEEDKWPLFHADHPRFGLGTTYDDCIYHAFYSRNNLSDRFLDKCKTILMVNG